MDKLKGGRFARRDWRKERYRLDPKKFSRTRNNNSKAELGNTGEAQGEGLTGDQNPSYLNLADSMNCILMPRTSRSRLACRSWLGRENPGAKCCIPGSPMLER